MGEFFKCIGVLFITKIVSGENILIFVHFHVQHAISRKWKAKGEKHDHWLDFASDKFDKQLIEDVKRVLAVGFVFIPLPVFWALYDQQVNC